MFHLEPGTIRVKLDPFEETNTFSYLRHTVNFNNSNCEDLYSNLWKAQIQWGVGGNVSGEDGGAGKVTGDDVQGVCPGSDNIWEQYMGGHGPDDEGPGRFSP